MSPFDDPWLPSRPSSPNSRTVHASRIVDPSYSFSSPLSSPRTPTAYIDKHGQLHDPDFREFPPLFPTKRSHISRSTPAFASGRPAWENPDSMYDDPSDEDDEEEQEEDIGFDSHYRNPYRSSLGSRSSQGRYQRDRQLPYQHQYSRDYRAQPFPTYTYSNPEPSSPSSLSYSASPDDSDFLHRHDREKLRKTPRLKSLSLAPEVLLEEKEARDFDEILDAGGDGDTQDDDRKAICNPDWTPTCGQVLLRQWQTFSLSIKLSLFRAQRSVRSHLSHRNRSSNQSLSASHAVHDSSSPPHLFSHRVQPHLR